MEPEMPSVQTDDPLVDVPPEHYPTMLSHMRNDFPLAVHAHEFVRTLLRMKKLKPEIPMTVLAPGGDYRLGIVFFTLHENKFVGSIYCQNEEAKKALQDALLTSKKVPTYEELLLITCLNKRTFDATKPLIDRAGWNFSEDSVFWLPWYNARQLVVQLPDGVEIRNLNVEHADQINEVWPHKFPGSRNMMADQIEVNFGLGVFRENTLLSWGIFFYYGGIGAVQTIESEKRKGYGRAVIQAIAKKLGEMQIDVHLNVVSGNSAGEAFFKSIGFRHAFTSYWVFGRF